MFFDYHVHSYFSDDSDYEMEKLIIDAISMGLEEICITDHVDFGVKGDWRDLKENEVPDKNAVMNVNFEKFFTEIEHLSVKYNNQIKVKIGMEFGIQMHTIPQFQELYDSYPFDFIILSIHQINNEEFWLYRYQQSKTDEQIYDGYYEELLNLVKTYKDYSILGHMDLIRRYVDKEVDMFEHNKDIIEEILIQVIEDNKGIELNTSSKRYGINGLTPSIEILKLYHKLGGKIITVGSDSHNKEQLAFEIKEGMQILKDIGFEYICTFDQMKPTFHKL